MLALLSFFPSVPSFLFVRFLASLSTMLSTSIFFVLLTSVLAQNNDWSQPCLDGECFWDLPASANASGTVRVWGSATALSDITKAAGWTILDCNPSLPAQNIRLVCTGDDEQCSHLFEGTGAENTLVRLPTSCGSTPFARVARSWVHANQTLPTDVAKKIEAKLRKRQDEEPILVQGLALDTQFDKIDPDANGEVNVAIAGTTIPGQAGDLTVTPPPPAPARRSRFQRRGLFSFIEDSFKKFNNFDKEITKQLPPVDFDKSLNLFKASISCPDPVASASVSADVNGKAHAVVTLGMSAVGKIVPPQLNEFGVFVGLDGSVTGTLDLKGSATGAIDSGLIDIFSVGLPGLDFPGLITLGPTFKVQAQAKAQLDANVDAKIVLAYKVDNAKLFFPRSDSLKSGGNFNPADSPLSLSVAPSIASQGVVSAHLIPRVDLGVNALAGIAKATVFLNLDASASMTLSLDGKISAAVSNTDGKSSSGDIKGCIDVGAGLDVNAGAEGSFFKIFDKSTQVNLFSKKFNLLNKCVGGSFRNRAVEPFGLVRRIDLGCPAATSSLVSALSEAIPAGSIKAV
ncbi:hypothetical protein MIND_01391300 [Mycena indigotica]|uniref:DUF7223 domain-containing protein n=1 Tax=Mycena indigotica TaxID=2126181 RepID=A0A8H6RYH7_9AGAR|nr:uncharacterized protein MIND_01391300 [Mycena indigotica]KAF7289296.1 hypothetical protein MIND_01391300 [Mycena indigotica]